MLCFQLESSFQSDFEGKPHYVDVHLNKKIIQSYYESLFLEFVYLQNLFLNWQFTFTYPVDTYFINSLPTLHNFLGWKVCDGSLGKIRTQKKIVLVWFTYFNHSLHVVPTVFWVELAQQHRHSISMHTECCWHDWQLPVVRRKWSSESERIKSVSGWEREWERKQMNKCYKRCCGLTWSLQVQPLSKTSITSLLFVTCFGKVSNTTEQNMKPRFLENCMNVQILN